MLQLKEMVLALLDESNLDITSDAVEMIVDRVWKYASMQYSCFPVVSWHTVKDVLMHSTETCDFG